MRKSDTIIRIIYTIIGDGHIVKNKFRISIEVSNKDLLENLSDIVYDLFNIKSSIKIVKMREGKKQTYHLSIYSKAVTELLNLVFKIPRSKKSYTVRIPKLIMKGRKKLKNSFIIGLLVTEGSKKDQHSIRIASSSKNLIRDIKKILLDLNIHSKTEKWLSKKYKKEYFNISFRKEKILSSMRGCRSGQTGQILSSLEN